VCLGNVSRDEKCVLQKFVPEIVTTPTAKTRELVCVLKVGVVRV